MDVEDGRHFRNDLDDSAEPDGWRKVLREAVERATRDTCRAKHAKPSVYTGEGGVAYALLHLSRRGEHSRPQEAVAEGLRRLQRTERDFDRRRVTLLEGLPGNVALQAWAHRQRGDQPAATACLEHLGQLSKRAAQLEPGECEVLYGRCGFLGSILLVREVFEDPGLLAEPAAELVKEVVASGRRAAHGGWPLYYEWHGKCYFGGAHGVAGILLTLLQLPTELASAGDDASRLVRATADKLLAQRFDSGNLPSSKGSQRDHCIHWCHGAPGLVPLLIKMAASYSEPRYLELARGAGEVVWKRGLLSTKGLGLCHGIPGNGYALLVLHRATGDARWLRRAQHFATVAVQQEENLMRFADRPYSLFEGLAGALCFWADVLHASAAGSDTVRFPCYEF